MTRFSLASLGQRAGENFADHKQAAQTYKETAGVVEGSLASTSLKIAIVLTAYLPTEDGWVNARSACAGFTSVTSSAPRSAVNAASGTATAAAGAARVAYGHAVGEEAAKKVGKESLWGKQ